jgi:hypothetical protein
VLAVVAAYARGKGKHKQGSHCNWHMQEEPGGHRRVEEIHTLDTKGGLDREGSPASVAGYLRMADMVDNPSPGVDNHDWVDMQVEKVVLLTDLNPMSLIHAHGRYIVDQPLLAF